VGKLHHSYVLRQWQNGDVHYLLLRIELHHQLFLMVGMKYWPGTNIPKSEHTDFNWRGKPCVIDWPKAPHQKATTEFVPFHRVIPTAPHIIRQPQKTR
jgi:hypothetical protein